MDNCQLSTVNSPLVPPAGYKRTEVGVIPENWDIVNFADVADKTRPWSITGGPFGSNLKTTDYVTKGVRIIQLQNIGDGVFYDSHAIYTSEKKADELLSSNIYPGEIILSKMGDPVARCCFVPSDAPRYLMASDGIRLVVDPKRFNKRYVHDYINSTYFREKAIAASTGSTRQRIGLTDLKRLPFIAPPLPEQRAIADVLSDVDALIAALDRLIAKKRAIKQGAMQQLLTGQTRLPGFSGPWEAMTLGEIGMKYLNGGTPSTKKTEYWEGTIPWITGADVINQKVSEVRRFITEEAVKSSSTNVVEKDNLLVVTRTGVGKLAVAPFDLAISQDLTGVYLNREIALADYVFRYLSFNSVELASLTQGTSIAGITRDTLLSIPVLIPSPPEQCAIVEVLSDMDAEIATLESRRDKTRAIKQGMMQELLTGRIRLIN